MTNIAPQHAFTINDTTINVYHAKKGEGLVKHEHTFKHATVCYSGACIIRKENTTMIMTKDTQPVVLKENEWHEIEALEDNTCFSNIFATIQT